jgi:preprotein translocase subunit SecG
MEFLSSTLTVIITAASILLILLVLVQSSKNEMGLFQSTSQSVFGSRSGDVLTKTTSILAGIFLLGSFALAYIKVNMHKQTVDVTQTQIEQGGTGTQQPSAAPQTGTTPQPGTTPTQGGQARPATTPAVPQTRTTQPPVQPARPGNPPAR